MMNRKAIFSARRILAALMLLALIVTGESPGTAAAQTTEKVVRVGWYDSVFNRTDQFGRKSGYAYEYQQRIAIYTGWTYEYVEGSWPELLEKLIAGELDLLSDVSYTEERADQMLYSAEAMGSEGYHIFIAPENTSIRPDDFSTLNGKRVAVNKNSLQEALFAAWAEEQHVTPEIIEVTEREPVLLEMLGRGELDALVTLDTYGNMAEMVPVCKIGYSESFFAVNKNRPDLKRELDLAMKRLFEDNRDYNQQLTARFNQASTVSSFLTPEEKAWLSGHETIRVGYLDDFLPFCDLEDETGETTGALGDYLEFAAHSQRNGALRFEPRAFSDAEAGLQALKNHEIDCFFPLSISTFDGEQMGLISTDPLISTEMFAAVRTADQQGIDRDREMTVALVAGRASYESFVRDHFPRWQMSFYEDSEAALSAVALGKADCCLVSNYRISRFNEQLARLKLSILAMDEVMYVSFGLNREDDGLYSILNKVNRRIPGANVNSFLTNHSFRKEKITLGAFLRENITSILAFLAAVMAVILLLVLKNAKTKAKAEERRRIIQETERDALTGLYNWSFFLAYANRLRRERPEPHMEAAIVNIDRFHSVNALNGREYGDRVLREIGSIIGQFAEQAGGIACRFHSDRFNLFCREGTDWQALLDQLEDSLGRLDDKTGVHLRMGVKPWQEGMETELQFDKARIACNKSRGSIKPQVVIYDAAMEKQEEREQLLLHDFERALAQRELEVYYQPKYHIQSERPVLSSAEALVRWHHPELGMISPETFISLFERNGQISLLDNYVWEEVARQIAAWRARYRITLPVSVNLSRVDVFDPNLMKTLDRLTAQYGLKTGDMMLEVTESAYTENADQLIRVIGQLREKGYKIEMDDFGSGYSSLNMLSSLPVDVLKMDIAFIRNMERNEKDFRLVKLIIDIARYLKVPVVAEGVETESQLKLLKSAGCDLVQGYYFSKPLPAEVFAERMLEKHG